MSRFCDSLEPCGIAGSPDAIGTLFEPTSTGSESSEFVCEVEVKSLMKTRTEQPAREYASTYGPISHVTVCFGTETEQFRKGTLNTEYRIQCPHHAAVLGVTDVLFVVSSLQGIIYCLRITFNSNVLQSYREYLESVLLNAFNWIGDPAIIVPDDVIATVGEEFDSSKEESFFSYYNLCMSLTRYCTVTSKPIPYSLQIRPSLALAWNAVKGGTDEYSRVLSHCKVDINGSHPFVKYTFRFILTQLYNSFLSYRLFESNEQPSLSCEGDAQEREHSTTEDITTCTQMGYWASKKRNSKRLSFRKF